MAPVYVSVEEAEAEVNQLLASLLEFSSEAKRSREHQEPAGRW